MHSFRCIEHSERWINYNQDIITLDYYASKKEKKYQQNLPHEFGQLLQQLVHENGNGKKTITIPFQTNSFENCLVFGGDWRSLFKERSKKNECILKWLKEHSHLGSSFEMTQRNFFFRKFGLFFTVLLMMLKVKKSASLKWIHRGF